jgi:hypothetical protein
MTSRSARHSFVDPCHHPPETGFTQDCVVGPAGLELATKRFWSPEPIINGRRRVFARSLGRQDFGPIDMGPYAQAPSRWPEPVANYFAAFRKGLSQMGFVEGRNLAIEFGFAHNEISRLPELAAELVSRPVLIWVMPVTLRPGRLGSRRDPFGLGQNRY